MGRWQRKFWLEREKVLVERIKTLHSLQLKLQKEISLAAQYSSYQNLGEPQDIFVAQQEKMAKALEESLFSYNITVAEICAECGVELANLRKKMPLPRSKPPKSAKLKTATERRPLKI